MFHFVYWKRNTLLLLFFVSLLLEQSLKLEKLLCLIETNPTFTGDFHGHRSNANNFDRPMRGITVQLCRADISRFGQ